MTANRSIALRWTIVFGTTQSCLMHAQRTHLQFHLEPSCLGFAHKFISFLLRCAHPPSTIHSRNKSYANDVLFCIYPSTFIIRWESGVWCACALCKPRRSIVTNQPTQFSFGEMHFLPRVFSNSHSIRNQQAATTATKKKPKIPTTTPCISTFILKYFSVFSFVRFIFIGRCGCHLIRWTVEYMLCVFHLRAEC